MAAATLSASHTNGKALLKKIRKNGYEITPALVEAMATADFATLSVVYEVLGLTHKEGLHCIDAYKQTAARVNGVGFPKHDQFITIFALQRYVAPMMQYVLHCMMEPQRPGFPAEKLGYVEAVMTQDSLLASVEKAMESVSLANVRVWQ
jgi:hypothetical protein